MENIAGHVKNASPFIQERVVSVLMCICFVCVCVCVCVCCAHVFVYMSCVHALCCVLCACVVCMRCVHVYFHECVFMSHRPLPPAIRTKGVTVIAEL